MPLDPLQEQIARRPFEAGIVRLRFGLIDGQPRTLHEIGRICGITRERIGQVENETMAKLRRPSRSESLRD
jgi:RNA polymerase primary sigma factor